LRERTSEWPNDSQKCVSRCRGGRKETKKRILMGRKGGKKPLPISIGEVGEKKPTSLITQERGREEVVYRTGERRATPFTKGCLLYFGRKEKKGDLRPASERGEGGLSLAKRLEERRCLPREKNFSILKRGGKIRRVEGISTRVTGHDC